MSALANGFGWLFDWFAKRFKKKDKTEKPNSFETIQRKILENWLSERPGILEKAEQEACRIVDKYCSLDKHPDYYTAGVPESIITEMLPETHGYAPHIAVLLKVHPDDFATICIEEGFDTVEMAANRLEITIKAEKQRLFHVNRNGLRIITDASFECNQFFRELFKVLKHSLRNLHGQKLTAEEFKKALVDKGLIFTDPIYNINVIAIAVIYPFKYDTELTLYISRLKKSAD